MKTKTYPRYKPSGVEWLGDVPEHWEHVSLKWASVRYSGGTPDKSIQEYWEDGTIPWLNSGAVNDGYITEPSEYITEEAFRNSSAKWIPQNALVIALAGQGKTKGMVAQLGVKTTCNQSMAAIIPDKRINPRMMYWWLAKNYLNLRNLAGGEARDGLNLEMIGSVPCPLPPLPEQQAIAAFLDRQTGTIDALIARKQQLLELLKEQRTAMISRAVTKGLNPKVKMKLSGVEWLGDVPEHWKMKKMRYIFSFRSGGTPSTENPLFWDGHIPWVSSKDMKTFFIEDTEDHITEDAVKESATTIMPTGSLLVVMRSGILIHSIPASVIKYDMAINQDIKAFLPKFTISSIYYARFIEGYQKQLLTEWRKEGATVESLDMELINNFQILFPPFSEQQAIVEYLDRETGKIDALASKVETAIEKLKEYRTALISAAVTGKIDVREAV